MRVMSAANRPWCHLDRHHLATGLLHVLSLKHRIASLIYFIYRTLKECYLIFYCLFSRDLIEMTELSIALHFTGGLTSQFRVFLVDIFGEVAVFCWR